MQCTRTVCFKRRSNNQQVRESETWSIEHQNKLLEWWKLWKWNIMFVGTDRLSTCRQCHYHAHRTYSNRFVCVIYERFFFQRCTTCVCWAQLETLSFVRHPLGLAKSIFTAHTHTLIRDEDEQHIFPALSLFGTMMRDIPERTCRNGDRLCWVRDSLNELFVYYVRRVDSISHILDLLQIIDHR